MKSVVRTLALVAVVCLLSSSAFAQQEVGNGKTKLKALLVTGGCCHDYPAQIKIITQGLSQRVSIAWDVAHVPGGGRDAKVPIYENHDWIKQYDLVVHNECFGGVTDVEFVEGIVAAHVEHKVPGVFLHCAMHSYRNAKTDEWRKLLGVTSRSHEGKHPLDVVVLAADHPIMHGVSSPFKVERGELYKIEKQWDNCKPLAQAYGVDTKKDHTVIWTNEYQGTKVFGTTLGHYNETMNNDNWLGIVSRGVLWCLDALNEDGTPKSGYAGSGIEPIDLSADNPDKDKQPTPAKG